MVDVLSKFTRRFLPSLFVQETKVGLGPTWRLIAHKEALKPLDHVMEVIVIGAKFVLAESQLQRSPGELGEEGELLHEQLAQGRGFRHRSPGTMNQFPK